MSTPIEDDDVHTLTDQQCAEIRAAAARLGIALTTAAAALAQAMSTVDWASIRERLQAAALELEDEMDAH